MGSIKNNIKLKVHDEHGILEMEIPPKTDLLKETLTTLRKGKEQKKMPPSGATVNKNMEIPPCISGDILKKNDFKEIFTELVKEHGDYHYRCRRIPNTELVENESTKQILNRREFDEALSTIFSNVRKHNVKFMVVHVAGSISDDEKSFVIDRLSENMHPMPTMRFKTYAMTSHTLMEVLLFGVNTYKTPDFAGGD